MYPVFPGAGPATGSAMDTLTAQRMMDNLSALQKRQRRVKKLRSAKERFDEMAATKVGGGVSQGSRGALYDIQGSYIPDYAGAADKIVGGLGGLYAEHGLGKGKIASALGKYGNLGGAGLDQEEEELANEMNPAVLGAVEDMSRENRPAGSPTEQTVKAYLGMLTGQEMKDVFGKDGLGKARRLVKTEILDTGEIVKRYSDGTDENTGQYAKYVNRQWRNEQTGEVLNVPTSGRRGASYATMEPEGGAPPPPPPPSGPVQVGNTKLNIEGVSEEDQRSMAATIEKMRQYNVPEDTIEQMIGSMNAQGEARLRGEVAGPATTMPSAAPPPEAGGPTPTEEAFSNAAGIQPAPAPPRQTARLPNAQEVAQMQQQGKLDADIASAVPVAQAAATREAATRMATLDADAVSAAQTSLPKAETFVRKIESEIGKIDPKALRNISGGTITGRISGVPWIGEELAKGATGMFRAGTPEANTMAAIQVLASDAFLQSYTADLKGTGQISNIEGLKSAHSNLQSSLSQSPEMIEKRVAEFFAEAKKARDQMKEVAGGTRNRGGPAAAPAVKLPAGWKMKVKGN